MTRLEKRQEKRAKVEELKRKRLEAHGFTFSKQEYHEKRVIANRKCHYETPEQEELDRQTTSDAALKVYRRTLPIILKRLSKIKDPRQPKKIKKQYNSPHDLWNPDVYLPTALLTKRE